ncbi:MAG: alpha/beta hydrolase-fold protein [Sphingomicrobium sp.]
MTGKFLALAATAALAFTSAALSAADIGKGELSARPAASVQTLAAGETKLDSGGIIYRPATLPAGSRPLLVLLHGHGQDNQQFIRMLEPWADHCGAIIFAPKAERITWDIIAKAKSLESSRSAPRNAPKKFGADAGRIDGELKSLFAAAPVDPRKVAIMGFSDGASYALSLGLPNPDLFKWVIALSPGFALWPDKVTHSQHVFIAHGQKDQRLAFATTRDGIVGPLKQANVPVEFREFDGDHVMVGAHIREALKLSTGCARDPAPA